MALVKYNQGAQPLKLIPHDEKGRPLYVTEGTYRIEDLRKSKDAGDRIVASGDITFGGIDHALSAAAGPSQDNEREIAVASVASYVEGSTYLLQGPDRYELFDLAERDETGNKLYSLHSLRYNYTTTGRVRSVELSCQFPSDAAANEDTLADGSGPYQVVWLFTANGTKYVVSEPIWITRYDDRPLVSEAEVIALWPALAKRSRTDFTPGDALRVAGDDYLSELRHHGRDPSLFKSAPTAKQAIRFRAVEYLLRWQQQEGDDERAEWAAENYRRNMQSLLKGVPSHGTVSIGAHSNTAPAGSDSRAKEGLFRRS